MHPANRTGDARERTPMGGPTDIKVSILGWRRRKHEHVEAVLADAARALDEGDVEAARSVLEPLVDGPFDPEASAILDRIVARGES